MYFYYQGFGFEYQPSKKDIKEWLKQEGFDYVPRKSELREVTFQFWTNKKYTKKFESFIIN